jgi:plastocyanin
MRMEEMMSRRLLVLVGSMAMLSLAACSGGTATSPGAGSPAPTTAASEPAGSAAAGACAPSTAAATVTAAMADIAFEPAQISAKVGDVIAWTNEDSVQHTATLKDDPACTTANLGGGETGALMFSAAGSYPFFCKIHPSMTGTIEVTS